MDNDTMVEVYKYLNYYQLAKNLLVSKRFRDLIQTHRHKLALLYIDSLVMFPCTVYTRTTFISMLNKELCFEAYNEWVIRNGYSKQIPLEDQATEKQSAHYEDDGFQLSAHYTDPNAYQYVDNTLFFCFTMLNHEYWPLYQHFVRLLMDPFVYIRNVELVPQNDVLNLFARAADQYRSRLQYKQLKFYVDGDSSIPQFINWMKNHIFCDEILVISLGYVIYNYEEELLDLLVTGAHCTSEFNFVYHDSSKVIVDFVKKFMDLKSSDEFQMVESIRGKIDYRVIREVLKRDYAKFSVRKERDEEVVITEHVLEFINNDVGKKLQFTSEIVNMHDEFVLKINNL